MATNVKQATTKDQVTNGRAEEPVEDWPRSEDGLQVSEALYWEKYYHTPDSDSDFSYEWNNGILEVKPMSDPLQYGLYAWFVALIHAYLEVYPVAQTMALELGFRLPMADKVTIRKPDLLVVRHDNPNPLGLYDRTYHGICDLCVESLSDSGSREVIRDIRAKKEEYAAVGVREYFLLDAKDIHMAFYRLGERGVYEEIRADANGVIRSEVLPGFQFRVADLDRRPTLRELADDEAYQHYVMLPYQQERARAEQERARAEQERARAEQERVRAEQERVRAEQEHTRAQYEHTRAERLAARLRELGVDEENL